MAEKIRRISPNPPERRWGWRTRQLVDCIRELVAVGDVFTYAMGRDLCGIDMQHEAHLRQSVKVCALEYDIVLEVVPGVGYQRLSEPAKLDKTHSDLTSVHRKTGRIEAEQKTVKLAALSELDRHRYLVQRALVAHLQTTTQPKTMHELAASPTLPALPPFDLEAHKDLFTRQTPDRPRVGAQGRRPGQAPLATKDTPHAR